MKEEYFVMSYVKTLQFASKSNLDALINKLASMDYIDGERYLNEVLAEIRTELSGAAMLERFCRAFDD